MCVCVRSFFSGANFFPAFGLNMKTCRVSSHIHSECGVIYIIYVYIYIYIYYF